MKKKVLSLAIIATSLLTVSAVAQNPDDAQRPACLVEGCDQHQHRGPKAPKPECGNPFEGLNLTDAQKAKLDQLRKDGQDARQKKQEERRKNREEARAKRDSLMKTGKLNHLRQIKEILTPEQYVTFLENMVVNQKPEARNHRMAPGKGKQGQRGDFGRCGHDDCQGHKPNPQRGDKPAADSKSKR